MNLAGVRTNGYTITSKEILLQRKAHYAICHYYSSSFSLKFLHVTLGLFLKTFTSVNLLFYINDEKV